MAFAWQLNHIIEYNMIQLSSWSTKGVIEYDPFCGHKYTATGLKGDPEMGHLFGPKWWYKRVIKWVIK